MSRYLMTNPVGDYHSPISSLRYETNLSERYCQRLIDPEGERRSEGARRDGSEAQMLLLLAKRK